MFRTTKGLTDSGGSIKPQRPTGRFVAARQKKGAPLKRAEMNKPGNGSSRGAARKPFEWKSRQLCALTIRQLDPGLSPLLGRNGTAAAQADVDVCKWAYCRCPQPMFSGERWTEASGARGYPREQSCRVELGRGGGRPSLTVAGLSG